MGRLLNNKIILLFIFIIGFVGVKAQQDEEIFRPKDYKSREQFEKFRKRRMIISAWQINELKEGALVVKLKTNINQINAFNKHGEPDKAIEKTIETYIINKNIMMAYLDNYKFSKIYFIYSNNNDSLLRGLRSGIFLDTNLKVDPTIVMNEKFYLVAEKDFNYNSSIGFVKEDSAKFVSEKGNPSGGEFDIVVKNKYGHQLKRPFPYLGLFGKKVVSYLGAIPMYYKYEENAITYTIDKKQMYDRDQTPNKNFKKPLPGYKSMMLNKGEIYETISYGVQRFDENLNEFYKESPKPDLSKVDPTILPFLY